MSETLSGRVVPSFDSVTELDFTLSQKGSGSGVDLYFRDGTRQQSEAEARISHLAGIDPDQLVLLSNGMAALETALEIGLDNVDRNEPVIACAQQLYSKTNVLLGRYSKRGIKTVRFDSGSTDDTNRVIEKFCPDIILAETVGNGPDVPILDIGNLTDTAQKNHNPLLIIDNTLPLPTESRLLDLYPGYQNLLVVESGTKAYTLNREMSGIIYSSDKDLIVSIRDYCCTTGKVPGTGSVDRINNLLPESQAAFDDRNRRIFENTGALVISLYEASQDNGADFFVSHPLLPTHDNYQEAHVGNNGKITPVFFLQCIGVAQAELAARLIGHDGVRAHADLGQSFGFDRTRILHDKNAPVVRISGGAHTNTKDLGDALIEAALGRK